MPGPSDVTPRTVWSVLVETPVRGKVLEALVGRCVWDGQGEAQQRSGPQEVPGCRPANERPSCWKMGTHVP